MATIKSYTDLFQSKVLADILSLESADMFYVAGKGEPIFIGNKMVACGDDDYDALGEPDVLCWSLAALLKLIPKHILRKDNIHYEQTFIPSFRWEITSAAIYYTDGNDIMDYVSFRYGENNIELIDAVFKMVVWLKEKGLL